MVITIFLLHTFLVLLSPAAHFDVFTLRIGPQKRVPFLSMAIDQMVLVTGFCMMFS